MSGGATALLLFRPSLMRFGPISRKSGFSGSCTGAAIGAAGPVDDGYIELTNAHWTIFASEVSAILGAPVVLMNDLEAAAHALPALQEKDLLLIGESKPDLQKAKRLLAVNVGTGFGAATLIRTGAEWISCSSEAGHMSFDTVRLAPHHTARKFTRVEEILSGGGVPELYNLVSNSPETLQAADIFARAKTDKHAAETLRLFTEIFAGAVGKSRARRCRLGWSLPVWQRREGLCRKRRSRSL